MMGGSGGGGVVKRGRSNKRRKMKIEKSKSKSKGKETRMNLEPESGVRDKDKATEGVEAVSRQKWVEWTCSGCGYIAKGELGSAATKKKEKTITLPQISPSSLPVQAPTPAIIPLKSIATLAQTGMSGPPSRPQTVPLMATKAAPPPPMPALVEAPQTSTPLQSANQRAKERKKKKTNSLQEMLAAKREREAAGGGGSMGGGGLGGMDLMDLMKLG